MKPVLQVYLLAACMAIALAKYNSDDFTDKGKTIH